MGTITFALGSPLIGRKLGSATASSDYVDS